MASIEKRGPHTYRLEVHLGRDGRGKPIRHRKTIKVPENLTGRKLKEFLNLELAKFQLEIESGAYIAPEKMLFRDFATGEWWPKFAEKRYSPSNQKNIQSILNAHILPSLGDMRLDSIRTIHLVNLMDELSRKPGRNGQPLSGSTQLNVYKVLDSIFSKAVEWRLLKENPMEGVERPRMDRWKKQYYDEEEAREVIAALYQEPLEWRLYFLGLMLGGFRRGELLALEWPDVDFDNNMIHIRKAITMTKDGQPIETPPKAGSEGSVVMPEWYMQDLAKYRRQWLRERLRAGNKWEGGERQYVFHNGLGRPWHATTPTWRWSKFIRKYGLKRIRLHDLRHTAATLLIEAGVELKAVQERLRHSRYQTTADFYAHVTKRVSKETAAKLEKFNPKNLSPNCPPNEQNGTIS